MTADSGIIRTIKDKDHPYFIANKRPFSDERLSWEARGVLAYLLSKPDDWTVRFNDLVARGPSGRDVMRRILHELQSAGYLRRWRRQDPVTKRFEWISEVYEVPVDTSTEDEPSPEKPSMAEPSMAEPSTVNPSIYQLTKVPNTDLLSNERESTPAASAAAPAPKKDRATAAPSTFEITDNLSAWASEHAPGIDLDRATAAFLDHHRSKGSRHVDWIAAWRNWMRREVLYRRQPISQPAPASSARPISIDAYLAQQRPADAPRARLRDLEVLNERTT